jgi:hypothetical protein
MPGRIVKQWADELLHHLGGNHYELARVTGERIGELRAASDPEAIEKAALVARDAFEKRRPVGEGGKVLALLEGANKAALLESLDDDELRRLHGMLFTWADIAKRELEYRRR